MAIKGRNLKVLLTTSTNPAVLGGERSCKLNIKCDDKEVASVTSGVWKDFKAGRLSWSISAGGLITNNYEMLFSAFINRTALSVHFVVGTSAFIGTAILTALEYAGEIKGYSTYSVTLKGTGPLTFDV